MPENRRQRNTMEVPCAKCKRVVLVKIIPGSGLFLQASPCACTEKEKNDEEVAD